MVAGSGVLASSGAVKFSEIAAVFGYSTDTTTNIRLSDYYKNGTYVTNSLETSIPVLANPKNSLSVSQLMGRSPRINRITTKTYTPSSTSVDSTWPAIRFYNFVTSDASSSATSVTLKYQFTSASVVSDLYLYIQRYNPATVGDTLSYESYSSTLTTGSLQTITTNIFNPLNPKLYFTYLTANVPPAPTTLNITMDLATPYNQYY